MKVIEHLANAAKPLISFELIPPKRGGDIKALLSTGYSISGQAAEILERGCSGFIQKPFNIIQLSQKIREVLDKK